MFHRTRPIADPVTIHLDDTAIQAERGEPLAAALLAAGETALARSPKLHRPRGPYCLRGGCDGCLARVDGVPNVMTCLRRAQGGERIETQNVLGSRKTDLLRVTDWFFPQGIDHHHLLAGVPGVSDAMQTFARKLAGLGRLPSEPEAVHPAGRIATQVAVVGGGPAGIAVASRLAERGLSTLLVDDGVAIGGSLLALPDRAKAFLATHPLAKVDVHAGRTAAGVYLGELLVADPERADVVRADALVFATGAHDPVAAIPNADIPGVLSARAVCDLMARGIEPDGPVAIVSEDGADPWGDELEKRLGDRAVRVRASDVVEVHGTGKVHGVTVRADGKERRVEAVVVAIGGPGAPAFELAEQAGSAIAPSAGGYAIRTDPHGRVIRAETAPDAPMHGVANGPLLFATGESTGAPFDLDRIAKDAERTAGAIATALAARLTPP